MKKVSKNPRISVIVPVYNVEDYLQKCIDSILNQTYKNIEIILVDDGSTDNCPDICDKNAKSDKRIVVMHKKNGGLSDARNVGLSICSGEYITFVDSDDTLSSDFIENLYSAIRKHGVNISIAPYTIVSGEKEITCHNNKKDEVLDKKEAIKRMLLDDGFTVSACSKMYKIDLFSDVKYPKGKIFEDTATTYKLLLKCDKIAYIQNGTYYYYKRDNSIINSKFNKNQLQFITNTDEMGKKILEKYPDLKNAVESKKIDSRFSILRRMVLVDDLDEESINEKEIIIKYLRQRRRKIIFGNYNKKIKVASFLMINEKVFTKFWLAYCKCKYEKRGQ